MNKIIARWQDWSGETIEHLVLNQSRNRITADAAILVRGKPNPFAISYHIVCDSCWRVNRTEISELGSSLTIELASDGVGNWIDKSGTPLLQLASAVDIDISITPFTNTLPIRRLNLQGGQSKEIVAAYIQVPSLTITSDRQRYTCLVPGKVYRYESVDNDFTRDIEVDSDGLVVSYPGLFRRVF
jgi:uncharacterized protein